MKTTVVVVCLVASGALGLNASIVMTLDAGEAGSKSITDNAEGDRNPEKGVVTFIGGVGVWFLNVDTGITKPAIGSATSPMMDLNFVAGSSGAGTLTITFSDTEFGPLPVASAEFALHFGGTLTTGGDVTYAATVNGAGIIAEIGPLSRSPYAATAYGLATRVDAPFDLDQTVVLTHRVSGVSSGNAVLAMVPEPSTSLLGALLLLPVTASTVSLLRRSRNPWAG